MPKSLIPNPLERRHVLEGRLDAARAARIAEAYLAEGRTVEAIAFLAMADAPERLDAIRAQAIELGDAFLAREVARAQARPVAGDEWARLAAAAASAGKALYAEQARRQTDRRVDGSIGG